MNYTIIYRNEIGRFKTKTYLEYQPQVGNFITISKILYKIIDIEIIPFNFDPKKVKEIRSFVPNMVLDQQEVILYCQEVRDHKWRTKKHWLDNLDEIKEGV